MSNDNKLKLLQYLAFFPTLVCMMLLIDMNTSPYTKLFATISGSFATIMLAVLEFEDTYEERKIFLTPKHKKSSPHSSIFTIIKLNILQIQTTRLSKAINLIALFRL